MRRGGERLVGWYSINEITKYKEQMYHIVVQCTMYILRRICTHGLDSWEREIGILYVHTCRDGGGCILPIFHLLNMYIKNVICIGRKARGEGGMDY